MSRARGTATTLGAPAAGSSTRSGELPPTVLLNRHRVRALDMPTGTLTVDAVQGRRAANADSTESLSNQPDGVDRSGVNPYRLNGVRRAVPEVSLRRSLSFFPKQEWTGRVTAIHKDGFDARLRNLTAGGPGGRHHRPGGDQPGGPCPSARWFALPLGHGMREVRERNA